MGELDLSDSYTGRKPSRETISESRPVTSDRLFPSYRLLVVVLSLFAIFCCKMCQGMPAAALLIMLQNEENSSVTSNVSSQAHEWRYTWDKSTESWILSGYLFGYFVMQCPAGWLATRFGEKRVVLVSAMTLACLQGVAIAAARLGSGYFIVTMAITGVANTHIPWRQILTCPSVWAVVAAQFGADWISCCMVTSVRTYFRHVRRMEITTVGMLCGLPWAGGPLVGCLASKLIDSLRAKGVSTTLLRKLSDFLGKPVCASLLLLLSFLPDDQHSLVIILYTTSVLLLLGFEGCGYVANISELSPHFTGVIWSLTQTVGMTGSFMAPLIVGAVTPSNSTEEWRDCFVLTLCVALVTFLLYLVLGSSQPQQWVEAETLDLLLPSHSRREPENNIKT